jgi:hypothetical protein
LLPEGARAPPAREGFDASIPSQPHFPSENVVIYRYKGACGPQVILIFTFYTPGFERRVLTFWGCDPLPILGCIG